MREIVEEYPPHDYQKHLNMVDLAYKIERMLTDRNPWWWEQDDVEHLVKEILEKHQDEFERAKKVWANPHNFPEARSWANSVNKEYGR